MEKFIFDNSNLAESYSGVTTPLTYSFVQYVYQEVYKHFCRMMGVSNKTINQNEEMFKKMVEFIGYRMYYNLINWYKLVSFLPGYKFNKEFFEKMLGVQKTYSYSQDREHNLFQKYFVDLLHLSFQIIKVGFSFMFMGYLVERFNKNFDNIFEKIDTIELSKLSLSNLKDLYFQLSGQLLSHWRIPIANDFTVMVSTGMADKFFKKSLDGNSVYFYLYSESHGPLISLDPGFQIMKIAISIKEDKEILDLFMQNSENLILGILQKDFLNHQITRSILEYFKKFGSRIPNELKLETETINERPEIFIALLKNLVSSEKDINENFRWKRKIEVETYNKLNLVKKFFISWLLCWSGNSLRRREETRFRRALIFGYVRKIFLTIGQKLQQDGLLNSTRDIFYLTVEEVFDSIQGNKTRDKVRRMIQYRKNEIEYWKSINLPRRIETSKSINEIEKEFRARDIDEKRKTKPRILEGLVVAKSNIEKIFGTALVLLEFKPKIDFRGKILITKQTDPGWTIFFPLLKGLVIERGGMLSHAAIVARELNIPCIVGVDNATTFIKDGSQVQMDLNRGRIYV